MDKLINDLTRAITNQLAAHGKGDTTFVLILHPTRATSSDPVICVSEMPAHLTKAVLQTGINSISDDTAIVTEQKLPPKNPNQADA